MARTRAELEDEIADRDRRITDLEHELDDAHELIERQCEQLQHVEYIFEKWKKTFDM